MTPVTLVDPAGAERRLVEADFPLALELADAAAGEAGRAGAAVGWLGLEGGELFVQPATPAVMPIVCNGSPVTASLWLRDADVLRYGSLVLRVSIAAGGTRLQIERRGAPVPSAPGRQVQDASPALPPAPASPPRQPAGPAAGEAPLLIRPAAYVPRARRRLPKPRRRLRPVRVLPWALLVVLGAAAWLIFTMRSVEVRVEPAPDRMTLTGSPLAWSMGGRHMLRPGSYRLTAAREGYRDLALEIEVTDEPYQSFIFTLERLPGRLLVESGPVAGAEVLLDGEPVGTTPLPALELAAGEYRLQVRADRYQEFAAAVTVRGGGETETVAAVLRPLWSAVSFSSTPSGAALTVDGAGAGRTPATTDLLAGTHVYEMSLPGHRPFRATVEVVADTPLQVPTVDLSAADGRLRVSSEPAGAIVSIDGRVRGQAPLEVAVSPGVPHEVSASAAGHDSVRRSVQVAAGGKQQVDLALPARMGSVVFAAEPADAELVIDGEPAGRADQTLQLPAVPHEILIRMAGHESYRAQITPRPEFEQAVRVALRSLEQVQAEKTPPVYRTSQGQEMILIQGGRFTMGAPRRDPGRRSNEILRQVEITHPYYLAATEVSNEQFREFRSGHLSGGSGGLNLEIDNHPVVRVTWLEAAEYCNWLSQKEGLPPVYVISGGQARARRPFGPGYRLPTEAEWVWAARYAGGRGEQKYAWGDALPPTAGSDNYADAAAAGTLASTLADYSDGYAGTAPVDRFPPNGLGLRSLGGNVAEWMHDIYAIVPPGPTPERDPAGGDEGELHVIRGGSWMDATLSELRLSYREEGMEARPDLGFRIARSPE